ncbi:MAG: glycerol-3-phosphate dehydrogenase/oxidase [Deltaproteobacteria bacterium]|nr:glycerol-3-phosphate dehydrogenase/oxidase [Deltaproteobacteria bacterium]
MFQHAVPKRVRVLVLGGGIHGVGVLHDLVSRGWKDVHLIEKAGLANGTSSRSTKLIHGGLRYLKRISQFGMVSESLQERNFLLKAVPDIVYPVELILPIERGHLINSFMMRAGLSLYDFLSGKYGIHKHQTLSDDEARQKAPILATDKFSHFFSFWDAQTDDLALVRRIAFSAVELGAGVTEQCRVLSLKHDADGWLAEVENRDGQTNVISALYVVNCLGPWANDFLEASKIRPEVRGVKDKGSHLIIRDLGLKAGMFLEVPGDKRIMFVLPWQGVTLLGTTEESFESRPDEVRASDSEMDYLLMAANFYLKEPLTRKDIQATFAGVRWMVAEEGSDLSSTSRESALGEHVSNRGLLITVYGGKLTSYRLLAEKIGDRITHHFGQFQATGTKDLSAWAKKADSAIPGALERFLSTDC